MADMRRALRELAGKAPLDRRWLFSPRKKNLSLKFSCALVRENVFLGSLRAPLHLISCNPKEESLGGRSGTAAMKPLF